MRNRWAIVAVAALLLAGLAVWGSRRAPETPRPELAPAPLHTGVASPEPRREVKSDHRARSHAVIRPEEAPEDLDRSMIRDGLAATFRERFPERRPSEVQLDQMTEALLRMREARDAMRALKQSPDEGGELRRLRDELGQAVADFETTAGVPLAEVTRETGAGGITTAEEGQEVVFEPMEARP